MPLSTRPPEQRGGLYIDEVFRRGRRTPRRRRLLLVTTRPPLRLDAEPSTDTLVGWRHVALVLLTIGGAILAALIWGQP